MKAGLSPQVDSEGLKGRGCGSDRLICTQNTQQALCKCQLLLFVKLARTIQIPRGHGLSRGRARAGDLHGFSHEIYVTIHRSGAIITTPTILQMRKLRP